MVRTESCDRFFNHYCLLDTSWPGGPGLAGFETWDGFALIGVEGGEARSGGSAGIVALEQLSRVCLSGERAGRNKSVERAKAQDHRADKFPNVMRRTYPAPGDSNSVIPESISAR